MSIIVFLIVLLILVLVHEWGHFIVAKKLGMRVDEFGFGFPPRIFGIQRGETLYSINALPVGGFVKIYGEDALLKNEEERARDPDRGRSFVARPRLAQAAVLIAGVAMNALLAWVLFTLVYMIGAREVVPSAEATAVSAVTVMSVMPGSVADVAGIRTGAHIVSVAYGRETLSPLTPETFRSFTAEHPEMPLTITYRAGGEDYVVQVVPQRGVFVNEPDRAVVGVSLAFIETRTYPFLTALTKGLTTTGDTLVAVTVGLLDFFRDAFTLSANLQEVSGPVGLVRMVGDASQDGVVALMQLTAFISLNLVVINLLPFPALDGGRLLFVAIEAVRRKAMPAAFVVWANTAGFLMLIGIMVAVTVSDIGKLL